MIALLAAFVAAAQTAAARTASPINYENPGASARRILADLSRIARVRLSTSQVTADDILCLLCQDDTLETVMRRIAWAVNGEWAAKPDGYTLIRTPAEELADVDRERAILVGRYKAGIARLRATIEQAPSFDSTTAQRLARETQVANRQPMDGQFDEGAWRRKEQLAQQLPGTRALQRLALSLEPEELAQTKFQGEIVYASDPTPSERPIADGAFSALQQYVAEQAVWSDAATRQGIDAQNGMGMVFFAGGPQPMDQLDGTTIGKVLLKFSRTSQNGMYDQLDCFIADKKGKVIQRTNEVLGSNWWEVSKPAPTPPAPSLSVALPPELVEMQNAMIWDRRKPVSDRVRNLLTRPEEVDPVGLLVGNLLVLAARAKHEPLVADLSDDLIGWGNSGSRLYPDSYLKNLTAAACERNPATDWIGLRPEMPAMARSSRASREALGRMARRFAQGPPPTLDERAAFLAALPDPQSNGMPGWLRRALSKKFTDVYYDERLLRLYGLLSPEQRQAAKGPGLRLDALSAEGIETLVKMVYAPWSNLTIKHPSDPRGPTAGYTFGDLEREPTECLPNGIPGSGLLHVNATTEAVVQPPKSPSQPSYGWNNSMSAQSLAWQKFAQSHIALFPWMTQQNQTVALDKLIFGTETTYAFTVDFTPIVSFSNSLQDSNFGDERVMTYDELPKEYRDDVEKQLAQYAESYKNFKPGQMNGNVRVPARINPPPR